MRTVTLAPAAEAPSRRAVVVILYVARYAVSVRRLEKRGSVVVARGCCCGAGGVARRRWPLSAVCVAASAAQPGQPGLAMPGWPSRLAGQVGQAGLATNGLTFFRSFSVGFPLLSEFLKSRLLQHFLPSFAPGVQGSRQSWGKNGT